MAFNLESHAGTDKATDIHPATPRPCSVPQTNFMDKKIESVTGKK